MKNMAGHVYYSDKEYEQILLRLGQMVDDIDKIEDPMTKDLVHDLLQHFDVVHREAISRMAQFVEQENPELMSRLKDDYTIRHLLALYDLETFDGVEAAKDTKGFISENDVKMIEE